MLYLANTSLLTSSYNYYINSNNYIEKEFNKTLIY